MDCSPDLKFGAMKTEKKIRILRVNQKNLNRAILNNKSHSTFAIKSETSDSFSDDFEATKFEEQTPLTDVTTLVLGVPENESSETVEEKPVPHLKWSKYKKKYQTTWETDPQLSGWLQPDPEDGGKVHCKYCSCLLRAHKSDLYKHCGTSKHKKNGLMFLHGSDSKDSSKDILLAPRPSDQEVLCPKKDVGIYVDYSDTDPLEENMESEPISSNAPEEEISAIANRIGYILIGDIEKILKARKNMSNLFKHNGKLSFTNANLRKMAKMCVGHLAQKYLIESALESGGANEASEKMKLTSQFQAIEKKLETTMKEMKRMKMSFEGFSKVLPFSPLELVATYPPQQPSSTQHG